MFSHCRHPKNRDRKKKKKREQHSQILFYFIILFSHHLCISSLLIEVFHSFCYGSIHLIHLPSSILFYLVLLLPIHLQNLVVTLKIYIYIFVHKLDMFEFPLFHVRTFPKLDRSFLIGGHLTVILQFFAVNRFASQQ